jgi:WD40 repeat protein
MHSTFNLLAAGGHGGQIAVFGAQFITTFESFPFLFFILFIRLNRFTGIIIFADSSRFKFHCDAIGFDSEADVVLSFKGHGGWISGCQFVEGIKDRCALLTSANDKKIILWDLSKVVAVIYKL